MIKDKKDNKLKPITKEEKEKKRPVKKKDIEGFLKKMIEKRGEFKEKECEIENLKKN